MQQQFNNYQGKLAGWGTTESSIQSEELRSTDLKILDCKKVIEQLCFGKSGEKKKKCESEGYPGKAVFCPKDENGM